MFGHQDDHKADSHLSDAPVNDIGNDTVQPDNTSGHDWQHPGTPLDDTSHKSITDDAPATPEPSTDMNDEQNAPTSSPVIAPHNSAHTDDTDNLIDIKQQALGQLSPLLGHLDQSPEEKFRTTMMMIQASDDKSLIKTAYETAQQITDEKTRAQALLDVINEINYFTQPHEQ